MNIEDTLSQRGSRYGDFSDHSAIAEMLIQTMMGRAKYQDHHSGQLGEISTGWDKLTSDKRQALRVIADKIARILNGDPEYKDNWHDIQGYAKLAEDRCTPEGAGA